MVVRREERKYQENSTTSIFVGAARGNHQGDKKAREIHRCSSKIRTAQNLASLFFCFYLMGVALRSLSWLRASLWEDGRDDGDRSSQHAQPNSSTAADCPSGSAPGFPCHFAHRLLQLYHIWGLLLLPL